MPEADDGVAADAPVVDAAPGDVEAALAPRAPRRAPLIVGIVGAVVAVLIGVMAAARTGTGDNVDLSLVGQPAPDISGMTIDGERFDLGRRRGSWVLVNFFQSTCTPCVQEHPELRTFVERGGRAQLVTVVFNPDSPTRVRDFFAKNGGSWPVVFDPTGAVSVAYGVAKVPETWVIDPDGVVRARIGRAIDAGALDAVLARLGAGA